MDPRRTIVGIGKRLEERGFIAATDGNISCKISKNKILITPTGQPKGKLKTSDLVVVDLNGKIVSGKKKPSGEMFTHLAVYNARPDICAVIHAHLPYATALSLAGIDLMKPFLPEIVVVYNGIPTAPYATPSSKEGAVAISDLIKKSDLLILDRHGGLAAGKNLEDAYLKLEKLEHTAKIIAVARSLGEIKELSAEQIEKLEELRLSLKNG